MKCYFKGLFTGVLALGAALSSQAADLDFSGGATDEGGGSYRFNNVFDPDGGTAGDEYSLRLTFGTPGIGTTLNPVGSGNLGAAISFSIAGAPSAFPYIPFSLTLLTFNGLVYVPTALADVTWTGFDIDSTENEDFTDLFGVWESSLPDAGTTIGSSLVAGSATLGGLDYTTYSLNPTSGPQGGADPTYTDEENVSILNFDNQGPVSVALAYSSFTSGNFVWAFTGSEQEFNETGRQLLLRADSAIEVVPEAGSALIVSLLTCGTLMIRKRRAAAPILG